MPDADATMTEMTKPSDLPSPTGGYFTCPHCHAYASQSHYELLKMDYTKKSRAEQLANAQVVGTGPPSPISDCYHSVVEEVSLTRCTKCSGWIYWLEGRMLYPPAADVPPPNEDLPEDIKRDYMEAGAVLSQSPRSAAALLRLAVQKLCIRLGQPGKNINDDIAALVKDGMSPTVQKALDALRVIGNESVHPGELDMRDDFDTASQLFVALNFVAEDRLTRPRQMHELFDKIPAAKQAAIVQRDAPKA